MGREIQGLGQVTSTEVQVLPLNGRIRKRVLEMRGTRYEANDSLLAQTIKCQKIKIPEPRPWR
jgi:hypothetical protein